MLQLKFIIRIFCSKKQYITFGGKFIVRRQGLVVAALAVAVVVAVVVAQELVVRKGVAVVVVVVVVEVGSRMYLQVADSCR